MTEFFTEEMAGRYDQNFAKLAPLRDAFHLLTQLALQHLPPNARILCVGAGTGAEILFLARAFPGWHFTAVDPSVPMLNRCRLRCEDAGIAARCHFHEGYVDSLDERNFDAATAILVSQFLLDPAQRVAFFRAIAHRLQAQAPMLTLDLAIPTTCEQPLKKLWKRAWCFAGHAPEDVEKMFEMFGKHVAVVPPEELAEMIASAGFDDPVPCYQALLMHGFVAHVGETAGQ